MTLERDVDYTVSYGSNVEVGTATVTVTGVGNYKGSLGTTFQIANTILWVEGTLYTSAASGNASGGGSWTWDGEGKLELTNYVGGPIFGENSVDLVLTGTNVVNVGEENLRNHWSDTYYAGIKLYGNSELSVSGTGTLLVRSDNVAELVGQTEGYVRVDAIDVNALTVDGVSSLEVRAQGDDDGALQASFVGGILADHLTIVNGSTVSVDANASGDVGAIVGYNGLCVTDSSLTVNASSGTDNYVYSHNAIHYTNSVELQNAVVNVVGHNVYPLSIDGTMTVRNSDLTSKAEQEEDYSGEVTLKAVRAADFVFEQESDINVIQDEHDSMQRKYLVDSDNNYLNVTLTHTGDSSTYPAGVQTPDVKRSIEDASFAVDDRNILGLTAQLPTWPYTGAAIEPDVTVWYNGAELSKGVDYDVSYKNNIGPGYALVTVIGKGEYEGETSRTFDIVKKIIQIDGKAYAYAAQGTGSAGGTWQWDGENTLTLNGYKGGQILAYDVLNLVVQGESSVAGIDVHPGNTYFAAGKAGTLNVGGTGTLLVTEGSFSGERHESISACELNVNGAEMEVRGGTIVLWADSPDDQTGNLNVVSGARLTVSNGAITSYVGKLSLTDSTLEVRNKAAGDQGTSFDNAISVYGPSELRNARVIVESDKNGLVSAFGLHISNSDVLATCGDGCAVSTAGGDLTLDQVVPATVATDGSGRRYVDTGDGAKSVRIVHTGSSSEYANGVQTVSLNDAVISPIDDQTYTGSEIRPAVTVTLDGRVVDASQYSVSYSNNVNAGDATVTVTGIAGASGTTKATFKITPIAIGDVNVSLDATSATYTGSEITVPVTVVVGGKTLNPVSLADPTVGDYVVKYENNTDAGTATVTVTGKNNYSGTATATFTIAPAAITSVTLAATSYDYDGKAKTPGVTVAAGELSVPADGYDVQYANNTDAGTATVTVTGKNNYSGTATATFQIVRTFPDVPKDAWYAGVVSRAVGLGFISGYRDGNFGPDDNITRGQVAVVLWKMAGQLEAGVGAKTFPDVSDSSEYYYNAVRWASSKGVVNGYANGRFGPNDNVTREQLAAMLGNYYEKVAGGTVSGSTADFASMADKTSVADWAVPAVGWCFRNGIISGSGGKVLPQGNATRAQAAKMVVGLYDLLA